MEFTAQKATDNFWSCSIITCQRTIQVNEKYLEITNKEDPNFGLYIVCRDCYKEIQEHISEARQ
jgi:hypothetical protein